MRGLLYAAAGWLAVGCFIATASGEAQLTERSWGGEVIGAPRPQARQEWTDATRGENLLLGRPAWFSVAPQWYRTADEDDARQLTDGRLSERQDDRLVYAKDAVGWDQPGPYVILFDLEQEEPIAQLVVRFMGGSEHPMLDFPKEIELIASHDGKKFHTVRLLTKLLPGEKEGADWLQTYYLEESGTAYTKTFVLKANVSARYIGLRVRTTGDFLLCDEVAAIKGVPQESHPLPGFPETAVFFDSIGAYPRTSEIHLTSPYITPNWLTLEDTRRKIDGEVEFQLDLPPEVELLGWSRHAPQALRKEALGDSGATRWWLPALPDRTGKPDPQQGPLYLKLAQGSQPPALPLRLVTLWKGESTHEVTAAIHPLTLPDAGEWPRHHLSLGWMYEHQAIQWPGFFDVYRRLGFNHVPTFPYLFERYDLDPASRGVTPERKLAFLQTARQKGFRIVANDSPFHVLHEREGKRHPAILNQINKAPGRHLSPIYRGELYHAELERSASEMAKVEAETIFYDIELWHAALREAAENPAFQKAQVDSGLAPEAFVRSLGSAMLRDLHTATVAKYNAKGLPSPSIGQYNVQAEPPVYHALFDWRELYPRWLHFAMPSLYVQGNPERIHRSIAANDRRIGQRALIPWLTAGTYGRFPAPQMEWMIYESLLNGSSGLTYYRFSDFDPQSFYYHAKALATLQPYRRLLEEGKPLALDRSAHAKANVLVSAFGNMEECLLLLGAYSSTQAVQVDVPLAFASAAVVEDLLEKDREVKAEGKQITVKIPAGKARLIYVKAAKP